VNRVNRVNRMNRVEEDMFVEYKEYCAVYLQ
jgi:hypothetical protein